MTKKQWNNLRPGHKLKVKSLALDRTQQPEKLVNVIKEAEVIRFNSNCSQVLIRYGDGFEKWIGRLGAEV